MRLNKRCLWCCEVLCQRPLGAAVCCFWSLLVVPSNVLLCTNQVVERGWIWGGAGAGAAGWKNKRALVKKKETSFAFDTSGGGRQAL